LFLKRKGNPDEAVRRIRGMIKAEKEKKNLIELVKKEYKGPDEGGRWGGALKG